MTFVVNCFELTFRKAFKASVFSLLYLWSHDIHLVVQDESGTPRYTSLVDWFSVSNDLGAPQLYVNTALRSYYVLCIVVVFVKSLQTSLAAFG